ncbi:hypothetical protein CK556_03560 [Mesoplasma chauliocola]|uniref:Uncharacterized protein n=2 Tax=Mesoplasma chauliocola TaxID=216427 RepID=A0A249SPF2_9MOLU|nr:hypothetical protein CK556_03560 [Mesoplasma chauliocola]
MAEVQEKNAHLYKVAVFSMFIFVVIMIPSYIFSWIVFTDINLKVYFDNWNELKVYLDLPAKIQIVLPVCLGWGFFALTILGLILLKPFLTGNGINNKIKNSYWIVIIASAVLTALLFSIGQYEFSKFQEFYTFESLIEQRSKMNTNVPEIIIFVSEQFTKNKSQSYIWASEDAIWWILFIQIIIIFMLSLSIQNAMLVEGENLNINKYIDYLNKRKKDLSENKINSFLKKIFKNSDKNISNWTIFAAICIILPQFIYVIMISFDTTKTAMLTRTIHVLPELLKRYNLSETMFGDEFNQLLKYQNNYFVYCSLPIIGLGTTMATFMYFVSVSIRGENKSQNLFITQYFIIYINLLILTCLIIVSKIQVGNLVEAWNSTSINDNTNLGQDFVLRVKEIMGERDFEFIKNDYYLDQINQTLKFGWEDTVNVITESIILFSIMISSFLIIGNNILRTTIFKKRVGAQIIFSKKLATRIRINKNAKKRNN